MSLDAACSSGATHASGSRAAYAMASGFLSIAAVSISSCWAISVSAAGPSKVILMPSSSAFSSAPCLTACQNWCWKPFETRAMYISSPLPPSVSPPSSMTSPLPAQPDITSADAATSAANAVFLPNRMETPLFCVCRPEPAMVDREGEESGPLTVAQRVEEHRQQHDDSDHDVLPFGLDRQDAQAVDEHAHDERTDHGAE